MSIKITFLVIATFAPVTCFTPASLTPARQKWFREAEKKHSRVALLALPSLTALMAANNGMDPVPWLNSQPVTTQLAFYSVAATVESFNLRRLDKGFLLKETAIPGKLLNIISYPAYLDTFEDYAGRSAMIVTFLMLVSSIGSM